jgi:hypothetical protein
MTTELPTQEAPVIPVITREVLPDSGSYRWSWLSNGKAWSAEQGQAVDMPDGTTGTVLGVYPCGADKAPLVLVGCTQGDVWGRLE